MKRPNNDQMTPAELFMAIFLNETMYFVDLKRHQFRPYECPAHSIDFDSQQGRELCRRCHIRVCRVAHCYTPIVLAPAMAERTIYCPRCGLLVAPLQPCA